MELFFIVYIHQLLIQLGTLFRLFFKKKIRYYVKPCGWSGSYYNKINLCCSS